MSEARRTQEFAVAVRPSDPAFVFNLALVCRAQGDIALARRCCDQAIALDAGFAPAERLRAELAHQP
jgi:Flp pilus assembly protein TadD